MGQIDRLKSAFADERSQLEDRIQQLQDELDNRDQQKHRQDTRQQQAQQRQLEDRYQTKLDDLNRVNGSLQREKDTVSLGSNVLHCCPCIIPKTADYKKV